MMTRAVELALRQRDVLVRADALEGADLAAFGPDQQNVCPSTSTSAMSPSQRSSSVQAFLKVMASGVREDELERLHRLDVGLAELCLRGKNSVAPWRRTRITLSGCGATRRPTEWCAAAAATSSIVFSVSTGTSCSTKSHWKLENQMGNKSHVVASSAETDEGRG